MEKIKLNGNQLKIIAMLTMLMDHIGYILYPQYEIFNIIGRISFPIYAFLISEGFFHTKNRKKYFLNIFCLGLVCQTVFYFAMQSFYLNILLTFSLSIITLAVTEYFVKKKNFLSFILLALNTLFLIFLCYILPLILKNTDFAIDYGFFGVLFPVIIYFIPKKARLIAATLLLILISLELKANQWYSLLALPFIALYSEKRGKKNLKLLFYLFYPLHFIVLFGISLII